VIAEASSASTAATSSAWACCRCSSRAPIRPPRSGITGEETFDIVVPKDIRPQQDLTLVIHCKDGTRKDVTVLCRIDTPIEIDYYNGGGILPFVLRELMAA
jgi:aconitase A